MDLKKLFFIVSVIYLIFSFCICINYAMAAEDQKKPDLIIVKDFKILPENPTTEDELRLDSVRYKNISQTYVPDGTEITFACKVYGKDGGLLKTCENFSYSYFGIGPGAETPAFPYAIGTLKAGEYRVDLVCDVFNVLEESDKANNVASAYITVTEKNAK